jgi:hypothetical protein
MNPNSLKNKSKKIHLKVVKNSLKRKKNVKKKYYINTLIPGFTYLNDKGKTVTPNKCAY